MSSVSKEVVVGASLGVVVGCVIGYAWSRRRGGAPIVDRTGEDMTDFVHKTTSSAASALDKYIVENSLREVEVLEALRTHTFDNVKMSVMLTDPVEAQLFCMLLKMLNAKTCIEVGTYTGYNALNMALHIPHDGKVFALDIDAEYVNHGKPFFERAGVMEKIDIRIGPALDTMDTLIKEGHEGTVDFIYIDADKTNYTHYYEKGLVLLRRGGMIVLDNAFQGGKVLNPSAHSGRYKDAAEAINKLNLKVQKDERVITSLLKIADGVNLCLKL